MRLPAAFWIMIPLNALFWLTTAAFLLLLFVITLILRNRSERARRVVLAALSILTLIGFFVYKYYLSLDREYDVIMAEMGGFNWWSELPLHLCNINMILLPIAVLKKSRPLMSFCFFLGPLGAVMALLMPGSGFGGHSLLLPRMLGYYGTHFMVVIQGLALETLDLYRPRLRDLPRTVVTALGITFAVFCIDLLLRVSGLNPRANYFYAVETEGNFLLEIFRKWIPYPFLYLLPGVGILVAYMLVFTIPFAIADRGEREELEQV